MARTMHLLRWRGKYLLPMANDGASRSRLKSRARIFIDCRSRFVTKIADAIIRTADNDRKQHLLRLSLLNPVISL